MNACLLFPKSTLAPQAVSLTQAAVVRLQLNCDVLLCCYVSCRADRVVQPKGNAGEEAGGPERHPGERGGLSQRAGGPADGKHLMPAWEPV